MYIFILLIAGIIDWKYRKIPQYIPIVICILGLMFNNVSSYERIVGFVIPTFPLFILALKNKNIKGGDVKYLASLGVSIGIDSLVVVLFFAVMISLIYLVLSGRKSVPLAFVAFWGYIFWRWFV